MKRIVIKNAGTPLSKGYAIGFIHKISSLQKVKAKKNIKENQISNELTKFENAITKANNEIDKTLSHLVKSKNSNLDKIINVHKSILNDPEIKKDITNLIQVKLHSMETAINKKFLEIEKKFTSMKNPYLKERIDDYKFVKNSLIKGCKDFNQKNINRPTIIVLEDISPRQIIEYHKNKNVVGFCLKYGSRTSHASIILKSLHLPSIIEIKKNYNKLEEGAKIVINTIDNTLILDPNSKDLEKCKARIKAEKIKTKNLELLIKKPSLTKSGKLIKIRANIEFEEEIDIAIKNGACGVGLLRTEMFYLEKLTLPSRKEQFNYYKKIVTKFKNSVTIRTFDFGGDKILGFLNLKKEENPALGLRGIRFSLKKPEIFATQLEAILMASAYGKVKILLPMISRIEELEETKKILENCKLKLEKEKLPYDKNIQIGIMIEVPSVIFQIKDFAKNCDFFSIGTNDLTQYILAIDRNNNHICEHYDEINPSVLEALNIVLQTAKKEHKPTSLCGEIASNSKKIDKFLDLGIDELSVNTSSILTIKEKVINHK